MTVPFTISSLSAKLQSALEMIDVLSERIAVLERRVQCRDCHLIFTDAEEYARHLNLPSCRPPALAKDFEDTAHDLRSDIRALERMVGRERG